MRWSAIRSLVAAGGVLKGLDAPSAAVPMGSGQRNSFVGFRLNLLIAELISFSRIIRGSNVHKEIRHWCSSPGIPIK